MCSNSCIVGYSELTILSVTPLEDSSLLCTQTNAFFFLFVSCRIAKCWGGAAKCWDIWDINLGCSVPQGWKSRQVGQTESKQNLVCMTSVDRRSVTCLFCGYRTYCTHSGIISVINGLYIYFDISLMSMLCVQAFNFWPLGSPLHRLKKLS